MLFYLSGELRYSATAVWLTTAALLLAAPMCCQIVLVMNLEGGSCTDGSLLSSLPPSIGFLLDYALSATLLSNFLWMLSFNFATGNLPTGRAELLVLRGVSAVLAACGAISLVAHVVPRPVLAASAAFYVGLSVNVSCWWTAVWLRLQQGGLAELLPPSLVHLLVHERPIDWLRRDMLGTLVGYCRELLPLLMLPEEDMHHGLARISPRLRTALERRGLGHLLLPPTVRRLLLEPWANGPFYVRVRAGLPSPQELLLGASGVGAGSNGHVLNGLRVLSLIHI